MFGGLGIQGNPYGSLIRNVLECSFAEERKGAGKLKLGPVLMDRSKGNIFPYIKMRPLWYS